MPQTITEADTDTGTEEEPAAGMGRTDEGRTDEGRTDEGRTDEGRTDEGRTDEGRPEETRPDEPGGRECLRCYLTRMLGSHGCDNTRRWTIRWRDRRARDDGRLLRRVEERGGICCDCEVIFNVWESEMDTEAPRSCSGASHTDPLVPCGAWSAYPQSLVKEPYEEEAW